MDQNKINEVALNLIAEVAAGVWQSQSEEWTRELAYINGICAMAADLNKKSKERLMVEY